MDLKGVGHNHLITMETVEGTGVSANTVDSRGDCVEHTVNGVMHCLVLSESAEQNHKPVE